jgi:hypothetical protein
MTAFASVGDLATRLGRTLAVEEQAQGELLLNLTAGLIAGAVDQTDDWAETLDPVPSTLRTVCLEAVARVMLNPTGMTSESETLGAYSHTTRFEVTTNEAAGQGLGLTAREARMVRRAVFGTSAASIPVASIFDSELPLP